MTFLELMSDDIFKKLPLKYSDKTPFNEWISEYLNIFLKKVRLLDNAPILRGDNYITASYIKEVQEEIVNGLIQAVQEYYNGYPAKAYEELSKMLLSGEKNVYQIIKQYRYAPNESFYRIRVQNHNYPFQKKELFHIPFEVRNKVSTQRYSIPSFPSLYLGRTLYVCWEELKRPDINSFHVMRLTNQNEIKLLDLSPLKNESPSIDEMYQFLMTFPLIACCSVKVKEPNNNFKPEYIVPQLIMQWVRENDKIDGIRYKSTHVSENLYLNESECYNIVMPVSEINAKGYCNHLASIFEMTEPISWQLYKIANGESYIYWQEELNKFDNKLPNLEIIKGQIHPYSSSVLGRLELYIESLPVDKI